MQQTESCCSSPLVCVLQQYWEHSFSLVSVHSLLVLEAQLFPRECTQLACIGSTAFASRVYTACLYWEHSFCLACVHTATLLKVTVLPDFTNNPCIYRIPI